MTTVEIEESLIIYTVF